MVSLDVATTVIQGSILKGRIFENSPLENSPQNSPQFSPLNSPHDCLRWSNWFELWWVIATHTKPRNTYYFNTNNCEDRISEGLTEILPQIIRNYPQNSPPRPVSRLWTNPSITPHHTDAWIVIGMGWHHRNLHSDVFIYNYPNYPFLSRWVPNAPPMESIKSRNLKSNQRIEKFSISSLWDTKNYWQTRLELRDRDLDIIFFWLQKK